jgi:tryptophan-rich sensory protein
MSWDWLDLSLLAFIGVNFLAAMSGAIFKPGAWYRGLTKPWFQPPDWLFAPAWTVLFALNAVAAWWVWHEGTGSALMIAMGVYAAQLLLNASWSALFFGLKRMDWAMGEVVFLWLSVAATIAVFLPIVPSAGYILIPYLVWVTFAAYLNWVIWKLNPNAMPTRAIAQPGE